jgi:hypothetical protein
VLPPPLITFRTKARRSLTKEHNKHSERALNINLQRAIVVRDHHSRSRGKVNMWWLDTVNDCWDDNGVILAIYTLLSTRHIRTYVRILDTYSPSFLVAS